MENLESPVRVKQVETGFIPPETQRLTVTFWITLQGETSTLTGEVHRDLTEQGGLYGREAAETVWDELVLNDPRVPDELRKIEPNWDPTDPEVNTNY